MTREEEEDLERKLEQFLSDNPDAYDLKILAERLLATNNEKLMEYVAERSFQAAEWRQLLAEWRQRRGTGNPDETDRQRHQQANGDQKQ